MAYYIQIQHLLKLNLGQRDCVTIPLNSNTTLVKVKLSFTQMEECLYDIQIQHLLKLNSKLAR